MHQIKNMVLEKTAEKVPVMYGRFQPFTVEDLETLKKISCGGMKRVVLVYIRSHQGYANTPFKSATVKKMLELVKNSYPDLVSEVFYSDDWDIRCAISRKCISAERTVESDHNSIKAAVARLALSMNSEKEFYRCTPDCIHSMYRELRDEICRYSAS